MRKNKIRRIKILANALAALVLLALIPLQWGKMAPEEPQDFLEVQENAAQKTEQNNIEGGYSVPGSVVLNKTATPIEGTDDQWLVSLELYGQPIIGRSDIVLVMDISQTMTEKVTGTDKTKMQAAVDEAVKFIDNVLVPGSADRIALVEFSQYVFETMRFKGASEKTTLTDRVKEITADITGSTNIEGGLRQAGEWLKNSDAQNKVIVLLTDGKPNVSFLSAEERAAYKAEHPLDPPLTGTAEQDEYNVLWTIDEANRVRTKTGANIYTVGFIGDSGTDDACRRIADPNRYASAQSETELEAFYQAVAGSIKKAGTDAVIHDLLGSQFALASGTTYQVYPPTSSVSIVGSDITWSLGDIPGNKENAARLTYTVQMKSGASDALHNTNTYAYVEYTNALAEAARKFFPYPQVARRLGTITMHYLLWDKEAGKYLTAPGGQDTDNPTQAHTFFAPELFLKDGKSALSRGQYEVALSENRQVEGYVCQNASMDVAVEPGQNTDVYFKFSVAPSYTLNVRHRSGSSNGYTLIKNDEPVTAIKGTPVTVRKLDLDVTSGYHTFSGKLYRYDYGFPDPATFPLNGNVDVEIYYTPVYTISEEHLEKVTNNPIFNGEGNNRWSTAYVVEGSPYTVGLHNSTATWAYVSSSYTGVSPFNVSADLTIKHYYEKQTYSAVVYYVDEQYKDLPENKQIEKILDASAFDTAGTLNDGGAYNLYAPAKYTLQNGHKYELVSCTGARDAGGYITGTVPPSKVFFAYYKLNSYTATIYFKDEDGRELKDDSNRTSVSQSGPNGTSWELGIPQTLTVGGKSWILVNCEKDAGSPGTVADGKFSGSFNGENASATAQYRLNTFAVTVRFVDAEDENIELKDATSTFVDGGHPYVLPEVPYIFHEGQWYEYVGNDAGQEPGERFTVIGDKTITYTYEPFEPNAQSGQIKVICKSGGTTLKDSGFMPVLYQDPYGNVPGTYTVTPDDSFRVDSKLYTYSGSYTTSPSGLGLKNIPVEGNVIITLNYTLDTYSLIVKYEDAAGNEVKASEKPVNYDVGEDYTVSPDDIIIGKDTRPYRYVGPKTGSAPLKGSFGAQDVVVTLIYEPDVYEIKTHYRSNTAPNAYIIADDTANQGYKVKLQDSGTPYTFDYLPSITDSTGVIWECVSAEPTGGTVDGNKEITLYYKKKTVHLTVHYYVLGSSPLDQLQLDATFPGLTSGQSVEVSVPNVLTRIEELGVQKDNEEIRYLYHSRDAAIKESDGTYTVTVYSDQMEVSVYYTRVAKEMVSYEINYLYESLKNAATGETEYIADDAKVTGYVWLEANETYTIPVTDKPRDTHTRVTTDTSILLPDVTTLDVKYDLLRYSFQVNYLYGVVPIAAPYTNTSTYVVGQSFNLSAQQLDTISEHGVVYTFASGASLNAQLTAELAATATEGVVALDQNYERKGYPYVIEYYFDGDKLDTAHGYGELNDVITDKGGDKSGFDGGDYRFSGYDPTEGEISLTANPTDNVLRVYYVTKTYSVTVKYLGYDNLADLAETPVELQKAFDGGSNYKRGAPYNVAKALEGQSTITYDGHDYILIDEESYVMDGNVGTQNLVIELKYAKARYGYIIRYYYDGTLDNTAIKTGTLPAGATIPLDIEGHNRSGYRFSEKKGPDVIAKGDDNVVEVYYRRNYVGPSSYTLTVRYLDEETGKVLQAPSTTSGYGTQYKVTPPTIEGYQYTRSEGDPLTGYFTTDRAITLYYKPADTTEEEVTPPEEEEEVDDDDDTPLAPPSIEVLPPDEDEEIGGNDTPTGGLPFTGGTPLSALLLLLGVAVTGTGIVLGRKKKGSR